MQSVGRSGTEGTLRDVAIKPDATRSQILENQTRHRPSARTGPAISDQNKFPALPFLLIAVAATLLIAINIGHATMPDIVGDAFIALSAVIAALLAGALGFVWWRRRAMLYVSALVPPENSVSTAANGAVKKIEREYGELLRRYHEAKIRAETAERAKASFLAHLNHDLRTPLNHIIGFADLIGHQAFGPLGSERYLAYASDISRSGKQLLVSISDILELAEFDSGARVLHVENVCVEKMFDALKIRFAASAKRAGVHLDIKNPQGVELDGDIMCLQRMLGNLIDNAVRFTPAGGRIYVDAWSAEDGIVLEVTDTGIGIPDERIRTLTKPFNLEDALKTHNQAGMGLGLAIAKIIAELSGGQLAIQSTPAIGTTVAVSLPIRAQEKQKKNIAA
ncbi:hypothetical protein MNBD_ALPHA12-402 [hydrothermal vent metagenome]|uniref:histidine kinase n=1 Tax=hydrothermal vent metagenome TaxID=652676 RepID=A0A3B0TYS1_9ZZZZ